MQELPRASRAAQVLEDLLGDPRPVRSTFDAEDPLAQPGDDRVADVVVRSEEMMHDLVTGDRRRAVLSKCRERRRLACADPRDRDGDRAAH